MFKVICVKEVTTSLSSIPPIIKAGSEYTVIRIYNHPLYGEFYFLAEDLPTQAYAAELFARLDGPCEVALMEQRQEAEGVRLDAQFENVCAMVEKDGDTW